MVGRQRRTPGQWDNQRNLANLVRAYLIVGLGAGAMIALALFAATRGVSDGGWLQRARTTLGSLRLPGLPEVTHGWHAGVDVFQGVADRVKGTQAMSAGSLQLHNERLKALSAGSPPAASGKRK